MNPRKILQKYNYLGNYIKTEEFKKTIASDLRKEYLRIFNKKSFANASGELERYKNNRTLILTGLLKQNVGQDSNYQVIVNGTVISYKRTFKNGVSSINGVPVEKYSHYVDNKGYPLFFALEKYFTKRLRITLNKAFRNRNK